MEIGGVTGEDHVARVAMGTAGWKLEGELETEVAAIEGFGCVRVGHVQNGDSVLDHLLVRLSYTSKQCGLC